MFDESVPEADTVCDVDNGIEGIVSVRVEDSLEDGEPEEGAALACRDRSEEVRESLGRGDGSVGGGELVSDSTRLVCDNDSDFKKFRGDVAVSACVAVID